MFRKMRRNKQEMTPEESMAVLEKGTSGVLDRKSTRLNSSHS